MFKQLLLDLMQEKGVNQRQMSVSAGIPATTISGWINANRLPDFYALIKLSQFFDVSADYLLGTLDDNGARLPTPAPAALPLDESELLKAYRKLSYTGKARVVAYADLLHEQEQGAPPVPATVPARKKA